MKVSMKQGNRAVRVDEDGIEMWRVGPQGEQLSYAFVRWDDLPDVYALLGWAERAKASGFYAPHVSDTPQTGVPAIDRAQG